MKGLSIFGSLQNGGDGSVSVQWFESEALAAWDQEHLNEGWGECCITEVTVEGTDLSVLEPTKINTRYCVLYEMVRKDEEAAIIRQFVQKFFPEGVATIRWCVGQATRGFSYAVTAEVCGAGNKLMYIPVGDYFTRSRDKTVSSEMVEASLSSTWQKIRALIQDSTESETAK
jgi:hypothetical protein